MKRMFPALMLVAAFGSSLSGCDDDEGDDGAGSKGATAGKPSTSDGGAPNLNVGCDESEDTTCQNATDCAFVIDGTARTTAQSCGKGCADDDDETCARDCILEALEMTSACASCYADVVNCTITNCPGACFLDPDSDGCHTCQEDKGCRPDFNTCSGLPE